MEYGRGRLDDEGDLLRPAGGGFGGRRFCGPGGWRLTLGLAAVDFHFHVVVLVVGGVSLAVEADASDGLQLPTYSLVLRVLN